MRLDEEVASLKARLERLEATVERLTGEAPTATASGPTGSFGHAQLRAWLHTRGVVSDPSPLEQEAAERWNALPEEEKQRLRSELDHLPAGPMVSDIVIDQRR